MNTLTLLNPIQIPVPQVREMNDLRLGHLTNNTISEFTKYVIIGFSCDEGVGRNGGRMGASKAPAALRKQFYKLTPTGLPSIFLGNKVIADLGDIPVNSMEKMQQDLAEVVAEVLAHGCTPIILGGGHETAFGHLLGYIKKGQPFQVVNVDAHLDVRPLINDMGHSGSPFQQGLAHPSGLLHQYLVIGAHWHSMAAHHAEYVAQKGGFILMRDDFSEHATKQVFMHLTKPTYLSIDVDAFDVSCAPGVSTPNMHGLVAADWETLLKSMPMHLIKSIDFVEVNPDYDQDERTSRFTAWLMYRFLVYHSRLFA